MAERLCESCGRPLEADASRRTRMCRRVECVRRRARERVRKHRAAGRRPAGQVVELRRPDVSSGSLVDAVRETLEEAGAAGSWEGQNALLLAERLVAAERESGSAIAALAAKLESSMALALRPRPGESFVDELRRRRQQRHSG